MVIELPPGVTAGTFDRLDEMLQPDVDTVWMELGGRGHLGASDIVHASQALHTAIGKLTAKQTLVLSIGGFDEDPRSLWDVADVVTFLRRVMRHAGILHWQHPAVRMLNESTVALLIKCGALGTDVPIQVSITDDSSVSFERYDWRTR